MYAMPFTARLLSLLFVAGIIVGCAMSGRRSSWYASMVRVWRKGLRYHFSRWQLSNPVHCIGLVAFLVSPPLPSCLILGLSLFLCRELLSFPKNEQTEGEGKKIVSHTTSEILTVCINCSGCASLNSMHKNLNEKKKCSAKYRVRLRERVAQKTNEQN